MSVLNPGQDLLKNLTPHLWHYRKQFDMFRPGDSPQKGSSAELASSLHRRSTCLTIERGDTHGYWWQQHVWFNTPNTPLAVTFSGIQQKGNCSICLYSAAKQIHVVLTVSQQLDFFHHATGNCNWFHAAHDGNSFPHNSRAQ